RFQALGLMRAVESVLPRDEADAVPESPADRREIRIDAIDMQYFPDLAVWFQGVQQDWERTLAAAGRSPEAAAQAGQAGEAPPAEGAAPAGPDAGQPPAGGDQAGAGGEGEPAAPVGPSGPGWVVQIVGHHFHNEDRHKPLEGEQFVRETLVRGLLGDAGPVPVAAGVKAGQQVSVAELGIGYPVIVQRSPVTKVQVSTVREVAGGGGQRGPMPDATEDEGEKFIQLKKYAFVLQFAWQPTSPGAPPRPAAVAAPPVATGVAP
ncbi:MAG: hypothetical protein ACKOCX_04805, partial [Planctomycetota bacterium]